jgi:putative copper export protein
MASRKRTNTTAVGKETPLTGEVLERFSQLITTALGLVAALAWNTAIQNLFDTVFGGSGSKPAGQFLYATLITIVVSFAAIAVRRAAERAKNAEEERSPGDNP